MAGKSVSRLTLDRVLKEARLVEESKTVSEAISHLASAVHSFHHLLWDVKDSSGGTSAKVFGLCLDGEAAISAAIHHIEPIAVYFRCHVSTPGSARPLENPRFSVGIDLRERMPQLKTPPPPSGGDGAERG